MPWQSEEQLVQLLTTSQGAERKRLLGLLAQRRYRHRRKTQLKSPFTGEGQLTGATYDQIEDAAVSNSGRSPIQAEPEPTLDSEDWLDFDALLDGTSSLDQEYSQVSLNFSDERGIYMPALDIVKAHITILTTILKSVDINPVVDSIWNPFARSPFEGRRARILGVPDHYHPTEAQITKPHHPVFDLLPWPTARNKMLLILSLPMESRPKVAQDSPENVVMKFKFDIMDATEGVRIHGFDAFDAQSWEIGQKVFDGWWWAFDMDIIRNSDVHRQRRGAEKLKLKKPA